jgi:nucleotide-binding universal stress UspA family protein
MSLAKTILVATDFGVAAEAALDYAVELATTLDGKVVVVHAFEIPRVGFPDAALSISAELGHRILDGARAGLDQLLSARKDARVPIRAFVEQDDPWRAILDVARREKADLIVMGTHGRRGLPHALIGSVAEKVVRTSPVPVLIVRGQPASP